MMIRFMKPLLTTTLTAEKLSQTCSVGYPSPSCLYSVCTALKLPANKSPQTLVPNCHCYTLKR